jgi:hypothetical protein
MRRSPRPPQSLIATLTAALLAGCAAPGGGGVFDERITNRQIYPAYTRNGIAAMTSAGAPVEVRGAPPGGADPQTVVAALAVPGSLPPGPLRAVAPGEAAGSSRFVVVFGAGAVNPGVICVDPPPGAIADRLVAAVAYCIGSTHGSSALLTHARPLAPGDPAFTQAFRRAFTAISPRREPEKERDRCKFLRRCG